MTKTISLFQMINKFPNELTAIEYVESLIWSEGVVCRHCDSKRVSKRVHRKGYRCKDCSKDFSVKTGTIFEGSNLGLDKWLIAAYIMQTSRKSVSSLQLSKELGVTQKTAWFVLHRLRVACSTTSNLLKGIIEIDETYVGGLEKNKHAYKRTKGTQGRSTKTKVAVVGMRERGGNTKAMTSENTTTKTIQKLIDKHVKKGSVLGVDEAKFYKGIKGFAKLEINHSAGEFVRGNVTTNSIESVWTVLKRSITGTFHYVSKKHLQKYVNEVSFKLSDGRCDVDTMDRISTLFLRGTDKRLTYKSLVGR